MKYIFTVFSILSFVMLHASPIRILISDTTKISNKNVTYKTFQDQNNVYVTVITTDHKIVKPMLDQGITVYFDIKGKKKKNVYLQYPKNEKKQSKDRTRRTGQNQQKPETEEQKRAYIQKKLKELPEKGTYKYFETENEFHTVLNNLDIDVSFSTKNRVGITYTVRIPKSKINYDSKKDLSKLSIGVIIGHNRSDTKGEKPSDRSQMSLGNGQSRGGGSRNGPPGGGQGGGPPSGGKGGGKKPSQEDRPQIENQEFWFDANI